MVRFSSAGLGGVRSSVLSDHEVLQPPQSSDQLREHIPLVLTERLPRLVTNSLDLLRLGFEGVGQVLHVPAQLKVGSCPTFPRSLLLWRMLAGRLLPPFRVLPPIDVGNFPTSFEVFADGPDGLV